MKQNSIAIFQDAGGVYRITGGNLTRKERVILKDNSQPEGSIKTFPGIITMNPKDFKKVWDHGEAAANKTFHAFIHTDKGHGIASGRGTLSECMQMADLHEITQESVESRVVFGFAGNGPDSNGDVYDWKKIFESQKPIPRYATGDRAYIGHPSEETVQRLPDGSIAFVRRPFVPRFRVEGTIKPLQDIFINFTGAAEQLQKLVAVQKELQKITIKNMKRKPFNAADALAGKNVITSDGAIVTQVKKFDRVNGEFCFFGVCEGKMINFNEKGLHPGYCSPTLFMAMEKNTGAVMLKKGDPNCQSRI